MTSGSDSPPSSLLQDELFKCGGCGLCFQCKLDYSDYSSGGEQAFPFTCVTCDMDFPSEYSYDKHVWEHHEEKRIFCHEGNETIENFTKRQKLRSGDKEDIQQDAASVDETLVRPENSSSQTHPTNEISSNSLLKRRICHYTSDSSTDTNDSLNGRTRAKQMKLNVPNKTSERRGIIVQHEGTKSKAGSLQMALDSDSDVVNISALGFDSSDSYEADASSISTEDRPNTSYSSVEETSGSPVTTQLSEAPAKPASTTHRKKQKKVPERVSLFRASFTSSDESSQSGPSGKSNEPQHRSKLVEPETPSCKEVVNPTTSWDGSCFQLPSGKAHELRPKLLIPSTSSLEYIFNIDQPSTSSDDQLSFGKAITHRPSFRLPSSPFGKGTYDTRQPSTSSGDLLSFQEANARRLRALLELPPILNMTGASTSSCGGGPPLPSGKSNDGPLIMPSSNSSSERLYDSDEALSGEDDYSNPSSGGENPKAVFAGGTEEALSTRSLNIQRELLTGESAKKFKCEFCGRRYKHKSSLIRHGEIHTQKTRPTCDKCGRTFAAERALIEHLLHVCGPHKIICRFCEKVFSCKREMSRHEKKYHSHDTVAKRMKDL